MTPGDDKVKAARAIARLLVVGVSCLGLTYAGLVLWAISRLIWSRTPIDPSVLRQDPWDTGCLIFPIMIGGALLLEMLVNGWSRSPLRRVLLEDRPSDRTDMFYLLINITGMSRLLVVLMSCGLVVQFEHAMDLGDTRLASDLPLWAAVPLVYFLADLVGYWGHRLQHTAWFWPFHAVHHAAEDMTVLSSFRHHPIDKFAGEVWSMLPLGLLGFSPDAIMIGMTILGMQVVLTHSTLPFPIWLEGIFAGPRAHAIHHGIEESCFNTNFGSVTLYDRLFGTYHMRDISNLRTGLADPFYRSGHPATEMFAVVSRVFSNGRAILDLNKSCDKP